MKRDVTRLGKRTKQGAFDDGVNSAKRYFINNYQDESRQKGIDILLGFVTIDGVQSTVRTHARTHVRIFYFFVFLFFIFRVTNPLGTVRMYVRTYVRDFFL